MLSASIDFRIAAVVAVAAALAVAGDGPKGAGGTPPDAPMKAGGAGKAKGQGEAGPESGGEARFYERLDREDREALKTITGWRLPAPTATLKWIGTEPMSRDDFKGKVFVIQSVGGKSSARAALDKVKKSLPEGVVLIGLHTPDQADRAEAGLSNNPPCPVAVDESGTWCDALGVWKRPVNLVVDKAGAVRFAGLSEAGLKAKLPELLAEEADETIEARDRPQEAGASEAKPAEPVKWPEFIAPVQAAADMRGKTIPGFTVPKWITARPDIGGRLLAIDFWATWCGPCRAAIPHVNELTDKHGKDVCFVGISDEKDSAFTDGLKKAKLKAADFRYALGLDPAGALKKGFFQIKGIPHMAIISPDGVVRWQGHPMSLEEADLEKLIAANRANAAPAPAKAGRGWAASGAGQKSR